MSTLLALSFPDADAANAARDQLLALRPTLTVDLADAVVVERREDGKVRLDQLTDLTARGILSGGFWGALVGLIFAAPVFGLAVGMTAGGVSGALADIGIDDGFMKRLGADLQPGTAALFLLVRHMATDKVLDHLDGLGEASVLYTNLDVQDEQALRARIEAAQADVRVERPSADTDGAAADGSVA